MKTLTETRGLRDLRKIKDDYRKFIRENYEHRAQDCAICPTKGACCLDAHFVNVHISKLEAVAIAKILAKFDAEKRREIYRRIAETVKRFDLRSGGDSYAKTYACPLYEKSYGCLVHLEGKPAPCISHACYQNQADLPPDELQTAVENRVERLNKRVYGSAPNLLPLPVWMNALEPDF